MRKGMTKRYRERKIDRERGRRERHRERVTEGERQRE